MNDIQSFIQKNLLTDSGKLKAPHIVKKDVFDEFMSMIDPQYLNKAFSEIVYLYWMNIDPSRCSFCSKERKFNRFSSGYAKTCGNKECKYADRTAWNKGLTKETSEIVKNQGKAVSKKKRGRELTSAEREVINSNREKIKGVKHSKERIDKVKKTCLERYGVESVLKKDEVREKGRGVNREKYGTDYYTQSEHFKKRSSEIVEKSRKTLKERTGFEYPSQTDEAKQKAHEKRKENGTYVESKEEKEAYRLLIKKFKVVRRQWSDDRYPFACDFYIEDIDTFIECNFHWTHGQEPFDSKNPYHLQELKELKSKGDYEDIAADVWSISDPLKVETARQSGANLLCFYTLRELELWASSFPDRDRIDLPSDLKYEFDEELALREIKNLREKGADYNSNIYGTEAINYFQQEVFYAKEKELWESSLDLRERLYQNRMAYTQAPSNILHRDLLKGFRNSGIYKGFSHFSPRWAKAFESEFRPTRVYDPFGGWGHRMLGFLNSYYIYNDLNSLACENVKKIAKFYEIDNVEFHNEDATLFTPRKDYDAIFTCPPYFNLEDYAVNLVLDYKLWLEWWQRVVDASFTNKDSCNTFAFVIHESLQDDMEKAIPGKKIKEVEVGSKKGNHFYESRKNGEMLLIYQKD